MNLQEIKELQARAYNRAEQRLNAGDWSGYWSMRIVISRLRSVWITKLVSELNY